VRGDTAQFVPWAVSLDSVRSVEILGEGPGAGDTVVVILAGVDLVARGLMCLMWVCP